MIEELLKLCDQDEDWEGDTDDLCNVAIITIIGLQERLVRVDKIEAMLTAGAQSEAMLMKDAAAMVMIAEDRVTAMVEECETLCEEVERIAGKMSSELCEQTRTTRNNLAKIREG